ncbi:MATE family efflux transporter [Succinivibrio dextrinosolvens]|uniref:Multidrug resistance protein, MATE family n=1 Tax=Succinivibrio dextrinosolvens TaxID=83771 RepID=A0A662Z8H5_9GAMM|nr:MATE family efflux transporter [Succinivibrio dextrinosolvens]SFJ82035.1 multidrug resistance protein, MATE family [Succinivibrio dextrinosolvens]
MFSPIYKKEIKTQLRLFLPFLIAQLSSTAMSTVDTIMAGLAGTIDLSGVAIASSFYWPAYMFLAGIAYGVAPTISHLMATKNMRFMQQSLFNAMLVISVFGFITAVILSLSHLIFRFVPSDPMMISVATKYLYFVAIALPATAVYNGYIAYAEGLSITRPALYLGLLQLILDIPFNYIFIFGKFGMPALGGAGCGLTTGLINILTCICLVIYIRRSRAIAKYRVKENVRIIDKEIIRQFLKLAMPLGISRTVEIAGFSLAAVILSPFGPTIVASHSITLNVSSLIYMIPLCLGLTATIRISSAMGVRSWDKAIVVCKVVMGLNFFCLIFYLSGIMLLKENIAALYSNDPIVLKITSFLMILNCIYMLPDSIQCVLGGVLQGLKDSKSILINTVLSFWVIGLPLGYVLAWGVFYKKLEASGIWIGFICALTFSAIFFSSRTYYILRYRKAPKLLLLNYELDDKKANTMK